MSPLMKQYIEQKAKAIAQEKPDVILSKYANAQECGADTPAHADKTSKLMGVMVDAWNAKNGNVISEKEKEIMIEAAHLHDLGKLVVPTEILDKNGRPTEEEFDTIKMHPIAGSTIITGMLQDPNITEHQKEVLTCAEKMSLYHHEKVDGTGYPFGLKGEEIPQEAQMMTVVDVLEALTAKRAYKEPMPFAKAEAIIREGAGKQFDPEMVSALLDNPTMKQAVMNIVGGRQEIDIDER